jgi:hypothetical protein
MTMGRRNSGLKSGWAKPIAATLAAISAREKKGERPGIALHFFLHAEKQLVQDVGRTPVRIIDDDAFVSYPTHFSDNLPPSADMGQESEGHDHIERTIRKGQGQGIAGLIGKGTRRKALVKAYAATVVTAGDRHRIAVFHQGFGQLGMTTADVKDSSSRQMAQKI